MQCSQDLGDGLRASARAVTAAEHGVRQGVESATSTLTDVVLPAVRRAAPAVQGEWGPWSASKGSHGPDLPLTLVEGAARGWPLRSRCPRPPSLALPPSPAAPHTPSADTVQAALSERAELPSTLEALRASVAQLTVASRNARTGLSVVSAVGAVRAASETLAAVAGTARRQNGAA